LFHAFGAATLKARSPNIRRVLGTCRSDRVLVRWFGRVEHNMIVIGLSYVCQWRPNQIEGMPEIVSKI